LEVALRSVNALGIALNRTRDPACLELLVEAAGHPDASVRWKALNRIRVALPGERTARGEWAARLAVLGPESDPAAFLQRLALQEDLVG